MNAKRLQKVVLLFLCYVFLTMLSVTTVYASASVGTVKNFKESSATTTTITLKWSQVSNVSGYQVYRSTLRDSAYEKVATVKKSNTISYRDSGLSTGSLYYYKIRAYRKAASRTEYGEYSSILIATTAPDQVSALNYTISENYSVILTWKEVSGASKYNVYYSKEEDGAYLLAGTSTTTSLVYFSYVEDTYYFKVAAVKSEGLYQAIGAYSNIISCSNIPGISTIKAKVAYINEHYDYSVYPIYDSTDADNTIISTISNLIDKNDFQLNKGSDTYVFVCPKDTDFSKFKQLMDEYNSLFSSTVNKDNYGSYFAQYEASVEKVFNTNYDKSFHKKGIIPTCQVSSNQYSVSIYFTLFTYCSGDEYEQAEAKAKEIAATFTGSSYDKIKAAFDYLVNHAVYDSEEAKHLRTNMEAHTAYGALIENLCVCDGFSEAFYLLMEACDIPCTLVINLDHCWNEVMIDNKWYFIDVTNKLFLFGQDMMGSTYNQNFLCDGNYYIWETKNVAYYGYLATANSSENTLAESTYINTYSGSYVYSWGDLSLKLAA